MEIRQKTDPSRASRSFQVIGTDTGRSATYDFLLVIIETMGLPCTVSVIKGDDCNILPVRVFNVPPRGFPVEFCYDSGLKNALIRSTEKV